jgi:hypothetical protein
MDRGGRGWDRGRNAKEKRGASRVMVRPKGSVGSGCGIGEADARESGEKVDQVFVSTSYFLGVEINGGPGVGGSLFVFKYILTRTNNSKRK